MPKATDAAVRPRTPRVSYAAGLAALVSSSVPGAGVVIALLACILLHPHLVPWLHLLLLPPLFLIRMKLFSQEHKTSFLWDFCYFAHLVTLAVLPEIWQVELLFRSSFIMANGYVGMGVLLWRNNLVLNSLHQLTSVFLHFWPVAVTWCQRWRIPRFAAVPDGDMITASTLYFVAWLLLFFVKNQIVDRAYLEAHPEVGTSIRYWLANPGICAWADRRGIPQDKRPYVFYIVSLVYWFCLLPMCFAFWSSYILHTAYMLFMLCVAVNNGVSYHRRALRKKIVVAS